MGTTLTGTTPQDTYESLIKVSDNTPLSGTAKFLSDGEGTDSVLALSTTRVGVGKIPDTYRFDLDSADGNIARFSFLGANATFDISAPTTNTIRIGAASGDVLGLVAGGAEAVRITAAGNVGIGTSAPAFKLDVVSTSNVRAIDNSDKPFINFSNADAAFFWGRVGGLLTGVGDGSLYFQTKTGAGLTEKMQLTDTGFLRLLSGTGGIQFNGDTAAANALDDYEEGTWTMGVSFGGASVGVTTSLNTGTYTKIGRQVTVNGVIVLTSKGSSSGNAAITGLPFTIPNNNANFSTASLWMLVVTFANQHQAYGLRGTTTINLEEVTEAGVDSPITNADFANNSELMVSFTYFV